MIVGCFVVRIKRGLDRKKKKKKNEAFFVLDGSVAV